MGVFLRIVSGADKVGGVGVPRSFADKVKLLRGLHRLRLSELACQVKISPKHLSKLEHGKAGPGRDVVMALADALGVSADDLLRDDVSISQLIARVEARKQGRLPAPEPPLEVAALPPDFLAIMGSALRQGLVTIVVSGVIGIEQPFCLVIRNGKIERKDVERRLDQFGGRRGGT